MKNYKVIYFLILGIILVSCGSVKEGFTLKKNTNDEFLVEKRDPLVLPPDYKEIPEPDSIKIKNKREGTSFEKILKIQKENSTKNVGSNSTEKSILDKIKKWQKILF